MTTFYSKATDGVLNATGALQLGNAALLGGRVRALVAVYDLATITVLSGDEMVIGEVPKGSVPLGGVMNATATMGAAATLAIGIAGTTGKYRTAAVFTAAAPTLYGNAGVLGEPLAAAEEVKVTVAAANLPTAGELVIVHLYTLPEGA